MHAQHGEQVRGDARAFEAGRIAVVAEVGGEGPPGCHGFEGARAALPVAEVGGRGFELRIAAGGIVFPDFDEAIGIGVGQGAEQDVVGEGEGGGGGADTERGDGDGGEREAGGAAQAARRPAQVAAQDVQVRGEGAGDHVGDGFEP